MDVLLVFLEVTFLPYESLENRFENSKVIFKNNESARAHVLTSVGCSRHAMRLGSVWTQCHVCFLNTCERPRSASKTMLLVKNGSVTRNGTRLKTNYSNSLTVDLSLKTKYICIHKNTKQTVQNYHMGRRRTDIRCLKRSSFANFSYVKLPSSNYMPSKGVTVTSGVDWRPLSLKLLFSKHRNAAITYCLRSCINLQQQRREGASVWFWVRDHWGTNKPQRQVNML